VFAANLQLASQAETFQFNLAVSFQPSVSQTVLAANLQLASQAETFQFNFAVSFEPSVSQTVLAANLQLVSQAETSQFNFAFHLKKTITHSRCIDIFSKLYSVIRKDTTQPNDFDVRNIMLPVLGFRGLEVRGLRSLGLGLKVEG
jgi:hypothetical protein